MITARRVRGSERARLGRALSRLGAGLLVAWAAIPAALADCPADRIDERATVARVHDGDTVRLEDGRSVRLIGIDAPELAREGGPSQHQPHAEAARDALRALLAPGAAVDLRFDVERRDRYRRVLAHLYLPGGESVQARLLEAGDARAMQVPPNVWNVDCYRSAEARARAGGAGLWSLAVYRPVEADRLDPQAEGFRIVRGRVQRLGESRGSIWLNLEGGVALRILRQDLPWFDDFPLEDLEGRLVEARGWLSPRRDARRDR